MFYTIIGKILKNFIIFLGPIYIKLGQILSYQSSTSRTIRFTK